MSMYRIVRKYRPKVHGDGSESFSREALIEEILKNGLNGKYVRHNDKGPGGSKQLTKPELYKLLNEVARKK
jgi:hypothetical protein